MPRTTALRRSTTRGAYGTPVGEPASAPCGVPALPCPHAAASVGATGLKVSRLGLGTMTWGRDTDEHEARDQLIAFAEAGGTLVDTAAGYGDGASEELIGTLIGDVVARDEVVLATKAGISRRRGERVTNTSRGHLLTTLDASLKRLGVDHVDLWQVHIWTDETPLEETLTALDHAVVDRPRVVRRHLQLLRLADRPGGDLAARRAGPGAAGVDPGGVLPAQPRRSSTRCCPPRRRSGSASSPGRRWAAACSPASTAPAPRPTPAAPRRTSPASSSATSTTAAAASSRPWPGPPTGSAGRRSRSRWSGCATGPASPRRSSAPAPPPSSREPWASRS